MRTGVSPWERFQHAFPRYLLGAGAPASFESYLRCPSAVSVTEVDELCTWLLGCRYASDHELFGEGDVWQRPDEFECRRCGDCDDFALWAWRKLIELGFDAELVSGHSRRSGMPPGRHVWVQFRCAGEEYLLETTLGKRAGMIEPLAAVCESYMPYAAVDAQLRPFVYVGALRRQYLASSRREA